MNAIDQAIKLCGGPTGLAEKLGVWQTAVSNWRSRGQVPAQRCLAIEEATAGAVTRYQLRPDVFGEAPASAMHEAG